MQYLMQICKHKQNFHKIQVLPILTGNNMQFMPMDKR